MKKVILRFVDWMEHGPAILTIWFIPLVSVIGLIAMIINSRKEHHS